MKYSNIIMDHFDNPRNAGALADATHVAEARNDACLDWLKLYLRVDPAGRVVAATFQAEGCVPTMAAGSWMTQWAMGRSITELRALTVAEVEAQLGGLPTSKKHAAYLVTDVIAVL